VDYQLPRRVSADFIYSLAARITKLDLHDESRKPIYFGGQKVKGQGRNVYVGLQT